MPSSQSAHCGVGCLLFLLPGLASITRFFTLSTPNFAIEKIVALGLIHVTYTFVNKPNT